MSHLITMNRSLLTQVTNDIKSQTSRLSKRKRVLTKSHLPIEEQTELVIPVKTL